MYLLAIVIFYAVSNSAQPTTPLEATTAAAVVSDSFSPLPILVPVILLLLLLLVGLVTAFLILWRRHKHLHTAREEASHTAGHTHPAVDLCEETGQLQYVSDQDSPTAPTHSSIQLQTMDKGNSL